MVNLFMVISSASNIELSEARRLLLAA